MGYSDLSYVIITKIVLGTTIITSLANVEVGLSDREQGEGLLRDEKYAVSTHFSEHQHVGEQECPERTHCPSFHSTQVTTEYPLSPRRTQYKRLQQMIDSSIVSELRLKRHF